jgi:hypothetical protein
MVTVLLWLTAAVLAGIGWRLWVLHGEVASLRTRHDAQIDARVNAHMRRIWDDLARAQGEHVRLTEARVQRAEAVVASMAHGRSQLDQRLMTVESWVRLWAAVEQEGRQ